MAIPQIKSLSVIFFFNWLENVGYTGLEGQEPHNVSVGINFDGSDLMSK